MHSSLLIMILGISLLLVPGMTGICSADWFGRESHKVIIIQGTSSLKDPSEKPLATRLAKQFDTWLTDSGVAHKMLTDDEVSPWRLRRARVVILPYNPYPSPPELQTLQNVVNSGGILLVFYGMDPAVAALMDVNLGTYQSAKSGTPWTSFEFDHTSLPGLPARVFQTSPHLIPVSPASGSAHVIAHWTDAHGTRMPEAAWIQSKAGFWMTHVLQSGDEEPKRQMLLAMIATVIPDIWNHATEYRLSPKRPFGEYDSLKQACQILGHPLPRLAKRSPPWESYVAAQTWLSELAKVYVRQNLTNAFSLRGVWMDRGSVPSADLWPAVQSNLGRQMLNTAFIHVGNPLTLSPRSFQQPVSGPKNGNIILHAWLSCLNLEGTAPEQLQLLREQGRLQLSDTGETLNWLCPSHPLNRTLLSEVTRSLAQEKTFSGIHLDYIRYLNSHSCYCPGCRQRFELAHGHPVPRWPQTVRSGDLTRSFQTWRADQISACVSTMRAALEAVNPQLTTSAAVYGNTPACRNSVGQDWPEWLRLNTVSFVCPMNYTSDLKTFQSLLDTQRALPYRTRIYPGVGLSSSRSQLTPDQAAAQFIKIQNSGFTGFVLFKYNPGMDIPLKDQRATSE